jgi:hypothetical protein
MKQFLSALLLIGLLASGLLVAVNSSETMKAATGNQMTITVGAKTFAATLEDNATATAFKAMVPLKVNMEDVNANEKVVSLPAKLPTNDANPGRIQTGDLMIWTSRKLVLFYKSFPTSYSYTRLGRIHDPAELSAAVGSGP